MDDLRFDGRVAVITGAGRNLGRAYALALAARGAKVVVNDLGVGISDTDGVAEAPASNPALAVVDEIVAFGGEAVANTSTIATAEGGNEIVATALDTWGRIDILVNNAGQVRQGPVDVIAAELVDDLVSTQIVGTINVTRPAWRAMKAAGYGRIVNVSSGAAFGIPEMTVYGAAKMAVVGLTRGQALEGAAHGIKVNVIAPYASTRGNGFGPFPPSPELWAWLSVEQVAPLVTVLAHETCPTTGEWLLVGGGFVGRAAVSVNAGYRGEPLTAEGLLADWDEVVGSDADLRHAPPGSRLPARRLFEGFRM